MSKRAPEQKTVKILITGAYGKIGKAVIEEARSRLHETTVLEIDNNKKLAKQPRNVTFNLIRTLTE